MPELSTLGEVIDIAYEGQPDNNAFTNTLKAKLDGIDANLVSVKRHGVVGDGVTDDGAALNTARLALSNAGGGILFYPPGTYLISEQQLFRANVIDQGVYGGTVIKMANGANLVGMYRSVGTIPFFGMRDMILWGNRINQSGQVSRGLLISHSTTSAGFSTSSKQGVGGEINDAYFLIENVMILGIDGQALRGTSSSAGYISNVSIVGVNGVGIFTQINDNIWIGCTTGGTWHEGWECAAGSGRYTNDKAFYCGTGGAPDGSFGNYNRGSGFRITNSNQHFVGCNAQDTDGPGFSVQAHNNGISGAFIQQACNLIGTSENIGQDPLRGGGYNVTARTGLYVAGRDNIIDAAIIDKLVDTEFTPDLPSMVLLQIDAENNNISVGGRRACLASNGVWVKTNNLTAQTQANHVMTPSGPWLQIRTLVEDDATPVVFGGGWFVTGDANEVVFTDFLFNWTSNLAVGEKFTFQIAHANKTIQDGANIVTKSGEDITAQGVYHFQDVNGVWYEV